MVEQAEHPGAERGQVRRWHPHHDGAAARASIDRVLRRPPAPPTPPASRRPRRGPTAASPRPSPSCLGSSGTAAAGSKPSGTSKAPPAPAATSPSIRSTRKVLRVADSCSRPTTYQNPSRVRRPYGSTVAVPAPVAEAHRGAPGVGVEQHGERRRGGQGGDERRRLARRRPHRRASAGPAPPASPPTRTAATASWRAWRSSDVSPRSGARTPPGRSSTRSHPRDHRRQHHLLDRHAEPRSSALSRSKAPRRLTRPRGTGRAARRAICSGVNGATVSSSRASRLARRSSGSAIGPHAAARGGRALRRRAMASITRCIVATTSSAVAPGVRTAATRRLQLRRVRLGDDAADHDRDVDAALADLLDHLRGEGHVGAGQHRQADGVDVLVDGGRGHLLGRLEQARCRSPRSPASRRMRATTFTPRSWPSRPTLATRMRSLMPTARWW